MTIFNEYLQILYIGCLASQIKMMMLPMTQRNVNLYTYIITNWSHLLNLYNVLLTRGTICFVLLHNSYLLNIISKTFTIKNHG